MSTSPFIRRLSWAFTIETPGEETRDPVTDELTTGEPTSAPAKGLWKPADEQPDTGGYVPQLVGKLILWMRPGPTFGGNDQVRLPTTEYAGLWDVVGTPRHVPNPRTRRTLYVKATLERAT